MATFEINDKDYELKLSYKGIKRLNGAFDGGSFEVIGKAVQGDIEAFPVIVHAALLHTEENFTLKVVEKEIEALIDSGRLSMDGIVKICDEVVTQSFFYKPTVDKLIAANPEMKSAIEQLRG